MEIQLIVPNHELSEIQFREWRRQNDCPHLLNRLVTVKWNNWTNVPFLAILWLQQFKQYVALYLYIYLQPDNGWCCSNIRNNSREFSFYDFFNFQSTKNIYSIGHKCFMIHHSHFGLAVLKFVFDSSVVQFARFSYARWRNFVSYERILEWEK